MEEAPEARTGELFRQTVGIYRIIDPKRSRGGGGGVGAPEEAIACGKLLLLLLLHRREGENFVNWIQFEILGPALWPSFRNLLLLPSGCLLPKHNQITRNAINTPSVFHRRLRRRR